MRKKLLVIALALLLCLTAGCTMPKLSELRIPELKISWPDLNLFDKDYYTIGEYQPQTDEGTETDDSAAGISNYSELVRAIKDLVEEHEESAVLQLQNYTGTVSEDLSEACWEVKASTALGAFAVDYISYDVSRIVSYYQAEINITYKRSAYQIDALEELASIAELPERIEQAIRDEESYLVLEIKSAAASPSAVTQAVSDAYYADPLLCPVLPEVTAEAFPESGMDRILEITLFYGADSDTLAEKRQQTELALDELMVSAGLSEADSSGEPVIPEGTQGKADALYALCSALAVDCIPEETAGSTAWDALVGRTASSEGMAMALEAACLQIDIPCITVIGYKDNEEHAWNIVTLDGANYHIDVSAWGGDGQNVFLIGDTMMWNICWWESSAYPVCDDSYYYFGQSASAENDVQTAGASGEMQS